jgi:hypothetical protein
MMGYVYFGILDTDTMEKIIKDFFKNSETYYIAKDIDFYELGEGLPSELKKMGQVFSEKGELRWKEIEGKYLTTLLTEFDTKDIPMGLTKVEGEWRTQKGVCLLVSLNASHISPKFDKYPKKAKYLEVSIYYKNNVATFVSPRGFKV